MIAFARFAFILMWFGSAPALASVFILFGVGIRRFRWYDDPEVRAREESAHAWRFRRGMATFVAGTSLVLIGFVLLRSSGG